MIKIYIGDIYQELADYAISQHGDARLLSKDNLEQFSFISAGVFYTSLGDLPDDELGIYKILDRADVIEYVPPQKWNDGKTVANNFLDSIQGATELILCYFAKEKQNVVGLEFLNQHYVEGVKKRKTQSPQLWVAGCSISHGKGVNHEQRYGDIIAKEIGLPVSYLTCIGSSISWQADQILRSDLKENDILIWGLTSENRFDYWSEVNTVRHLNPQFRKSTYHKTDPIWMSDNILEKSLLHENSIYQALKNILQVINFCKKTKTKLFLIGLLTSKKLSLLLNQFEIYYNYLNLNHYHKYADLGTDNQHPGPEQHKLYAKYILEKITKLNYV